MGLADISPSDIMNSEDVAQAQTAQDSVNLAAANTIADPNIAPSLEVMGGIDSSAVESVLSAIQDARQPQQAPAQSEAEQAILAEQAQSSSQEKPMSPYQKRVQTLINERKQVENVARQQAQQLQQMQLELQRQREAQTNSVLEMQRKQLEQYEKRNSEREEANLPEHERVKRQFERDVVEKAKREMAPELQAYKQELDELKAERQKAQEATEKERRFQHFTQQGKQVLDNKLLAGYAPEDVKAIGSQMEEMLYSFAAAYGMEPAQAAPYFEQFKANLFRAEAKRLQRTAGAKVAQSRAAPAPLPAGHSGASVATAMPSMADLRSAGFDNHVQWVARGRPNITRPK